MISAVLAVLALAFGVYALRRLFAGYPKPSARYRHVSAREEIQGLLTTVGLAQPAPAQA